MKEKIKPRDEDERKKEKVKRMKSTQRKRR